MSTNWGATTAAVAVAAIIAALGGAAIDAATEGTAHPFGASHPAHGGMPVGRGSQHGAIGRSGPGEIAPPSLHGEYVMADGMGGYRTEVTQTGTITAISPTSIAVRSEDGFSQTYVIPHPNGNVDAPFAVDDQVVIHATRSGQTATVTSIGNATLGSPADSPGN